MPQRITTAFALALTVPALAVAGCGGDDEKDAAATTGTGASTPAPTPSGGGAETTMAPDGTPTTRTDAPPSRNGAATSPEDQPGGAGDEVPNSTQALLTGKGGTVSPATVAVPPFIAITVELRSADGASYRLSGAGRKLSVTGGKPATASFDGLRTGRSLKLTGPQGTVTITANAEPGP